MAEVTPPRPLIETDDRERFDCGRDALNDWLRRHAWRNHAAGLSRTNVICHAATDEIVGYVTLSAAQIERAFLAKAQQRNRPDPIPATLLGQLAVHRAYQGRGYSQLLLGFALRTALRASRDIGSFGIMTHPLDETIRAFYARWGFEDLPFDPRRSMFIRMIDLERSGFH